MNKFFDAITTKDVLTENGMATHSTSGSFCVDLFYRMGATRQRATSAQMWQELIRLFNSAYAENPEITLKMIFYLRDIRGGQGERNAFRILFRKVCENYPEVALKNIKNIPFYGRWDDLFCTIETPIEKYALDYILHALKSGDKLCAKWMPREGKSLDELSKYLMKKWGLSPRNYRKLLAGNTEVVENLMCQNKWGEIVYSHVPSKAMYKYRKAWGRHDQERFLAFLERVKKGEEKINSKVMYPHEIVGAFTMGGVRMATLAKSEKDMLEAMWENLPDFVGEGNYLPICDVSGSMQGEPMLVSVSLGIYLSQNNKSIFKDGFITFSNKPALQILKGNLEQRISQLMQAQWDMNTNLEAVFDLVLSKALESKLSDEDLPKTLLIISDMQFDECVGEGKSDSRYSWSSRSQLVKKFNPTALEMISQGYSKYGYTIPNIVFWNVRNSDGIPAKSNDKGIGLVSGYSPVIMRYLFSGEKLEDYTPLIVVKEVVYNERYERVIL